MFNLFKKLKLRKINNIKIINNKLKSCLDKIKLYDNLLVKVKSNKLLDYLGESGDFVTNLKLEDYKLNNSEKQKLQSNFDQMQSSWTNVLVVSTYDDIDGSSLDYNLKEFLKDSNEFVEKIDNLVLTIEGNL